MLNGSRGMVVAFALVVGGCVAHDGTIEVKTDPFVGQLRTFSLSLDGGNWNAIDVDEAKGEYTVTVRVAKVGASLNVAHPGDKGEFAVGGQILTFENTAEVRPATIDAGTYFLTFWKLVYKLDKQQAARFAEGPLKAVKVMVGSDPVQVEPNAERAAKFQQNMATLTGAASGVASK
jgi:hypothetical protein